MSTKKAVEEDYEKTKKEYDIRMQKAFKRNEEKSIMDSELDNDTKQFYWEIDAEKIKQSKELVSTVWNTNESDLVKVQTTGLQQILVAVNKYGTYISNEINKREIKLKKAKFNYEAELRKMKDSQKLNLSSKTDSGKADELLVVYSPLQMFYDDKIIAQAKYDNLHKLDKKLEELNFVLQRILKRIEIQESLDTPKKLF
jgi:hypothetical protein